MQENIPDIPDKAEVVVRYVLERNMTENPDALWLSFEDGSSWSRARAVEIMYCIGNKLRKAGIRKGDRVVLIAPNNQTFLRGWLGCCAIGAVMVPCNIGFRGKLFERVFEISRPKAIIIDPSLLSLLDSRDSDVPIVDVQDIEEVNSKAPALNSPIETYDTHAIYMTSGTTGQSKGVIQTYLQLYVHLVCMGARIGLTKDDVWLVDLPLFHTGAMNILTSTLATRSRAVIRLQPNLNEYWRVAYETGVTTCLIVSSMVKYLLARPRDEYERRHIVRIAVCSPLPPDPDVFAQRFGVQSVVTVWGMTECGMTVLPPEIPMKKGSCGVARQGITILIADEHDMPVRRGTKGHALVRHEWPWAITPGYFEDPQATAAAWRNGWFHTGDLARQDSEGYYFFESREKDMFRRRGENVSCNEVESAVANFPHIAEVACVPCEETTYGSEEAKVFVVPEAGRDIQPETLFLYCVEHMPHFMVPRYIEIVDSLPKGPTQKVHKSELRMRRNNESTWDCVKEGFLVKKSGLISKRGTKDAVLVSSPHRKARPEDDIWPN
ncbi:MAG: AMP-binding protein [Synergistaceae bacterium]|nr:AMP-binding protein [Synergistaceae bacterium]